MKHILKVLGLCILAAGVFSLQGCDSNNQDAQSEEKGDNDIIFGKDGLFCNASYTASTKFEQNLWRTLGGGCEGWRRSE